MGKGDTMFYNLLSGILGQPRRAYARRSTRPKRPADMIGFATLVAKIATGEVTEKLREPSGKVRSGRAGGATRANKLSSEERSAIAKKAAAQRWG